MIQPTLRCPIHLPITPKFYQNQQNTSNILSEPQFSVSVQIFGHWPSVSYCALDSVCPCHCRAGRNADCFDEFLDTCLRRDDRVAVIGRNPHLPGYFHTHLLSGRPDQGGHTQKTTSDAAETTVQSLYLARQSTLFSANLWRFAISMRLM